MTFETNDNIRFDSKWKKHYSHSTSFLWYSIYHSLHTVEVYLSYRKYCSKNSHSLILGDLAEPENNIGKIGRWNKNQLEVLREHRPPPNASIIELLNDFCNAAFLLFFFAVQLWSESTRYFFDNPVNPDFGLLDPDGHPDHHQNLITWSLGHAVPQNPFITFSVIRWSDKNITSFFGRGKNSNSSFVCWMVHPMPSQINSQDTLHCNWAANVS